MTNEEQLLESSHDVIVRPDAAILGRAAKTSTKEKEVHSSIDCATKFQN